MSNFTRFSLKLLFRSIKMVSLVFLFSRPIYFSIQNDDAPQDFTLWDYVKLGILCACIFVAGIPSAILINPKEQLEGTPLKVYISLLHAKALITLVFFSPLLPLLYHFADLDVIWVYRTQFIVGLIMIICSTFMRYFREASNVNR